MSETKPRRVLGRISLVMGFVGIGVGLASLLTWEWIEAVVLPTAETTVEESIIGGYTPLVFLIIAAVTAPLLAGVLGIFEGLRATKRRKVVYIALGCFIGAALLVFVAGAFVGSTGIEDDGESAIGARDLISLAGLSGLASLLAGGVTSLYGTR